MVVQPRLVGVLLRGRSVWKAVAETDYLVLQRHPRLTKNNYRIITRGFPHYRVAEGDSEEVLQEELEFLSRMAKVTIQGKITSKKISTWLKSTFQHHSILAISPPEDRLLQQDDDQDHLDNHNDLDHSHDADGYLSDSSFLSHGEIIEPYSTDNKTRPPLRRAISLEDLVTASAVHHHLHTSGLLRTTTALHPSRTTSRAIITAALPHSKSNAAALLLHPLSSPPIRPASAASVYHPHYQYQSSFTNEPQEISYEPLKDRPQLSMTLQERSNNSNSSGGKRPQPIIVPPLPQDSREAPLVPHHPSLPTPEVSPEELSSDSSDDMVIVEGDLLEESKSVLGLDYYMRSTGQLRQQTYPGAVANGGRRGATSATDTTMPADLQTLGDGASMIDGGLDAVTGTWSWLTDSPFLDALVNWIEGPDMATQQKVQEKDNKPNPWLDIPFQFIALLTYPEPDPRSGSKMTLTLVRETSFVKQRRKTLMMLTAYTLVVRYCSLDFFILVLFASNCAMLFLMKNSGRMNVNMAKRAVRQRVGWAKQWAGSIFKRGGSNNINNNASAGNHGHGHTASGGGGGHHRTHSSSMSHFNNSNLLNAPQQFSSSSALSTRSSPVLLDNNTATTPIVSAETSPQMKRRGLFGKRVPITSTASTTSNTLQPSSSAYTQGTALSSASAPLLSGDTASMFNTSSATVTTVTTPKRRFFRRNQNGSNASTATLAASATTSSAPVPIPTKANTISHHPSHSTTPPPPTGAGAGAGVTSSYTTVASPTRSATAMATTTTMSSAATTNMMYTPPQQQQQQQQQFLSTSPLSQSQSLPQLQFSPLKPFNLPMLTTSGDTEMEQVDARWATLPSRSLATPPPVGRPNGNHEGSSSLSLPVDPTTASGAAGSGLPQHRATIVPSSSSSSTTSSPKAVCSNSQEEEGPLSPIPIPIPIPFSSASTSSGSKQQQGPLMLSGLSQLLGRSSSTSPPPSTITTTGEDSLRTGLSDVKGGLNQYGEMLPTTTTTTITTTITTTEGTLDAVTSAAAAAMEGV